MGLHDSDGLPCTCEFGVEEAGDPADPGVVEGTDNYGNEDELISTGNQEVVEESRHRIEMLFVTHASQGCDTKIQPEAGNRLQESREPSRIVQGNADEALERHG